MTNLRLLGGVAVTTLALVCAQAAQAQETTGSIRGAVASDAGGAVAGAAVTVLDTRTNAVSVASTGANGVFTARSLKVGGPYQVTIVADGFAPQQLDGIFVELGETFDLDVALASGARETIVVTGQAISGSQIAAGVQSTFTLSDLEGAPSISRDPKDVARFDPRAVIDPFNSDAISIGGANSRFNSFTVDGVRQNDDFGLQNNGYPTNRSPISFDVLEQIQVLTAPFDVEYSGFTGGNINTVTKSGGNEFSGSAFYYFQDDSLVGDRSVDDDLSFSFDEKTYGFTLGGPIVQDKLFFFVGYEDTTATSPINTGPTGGGYANEVSQVSLADLQQVIDLAQSRYGYTAVLPLTSTDETDSKLFAKLDWSINDAHRAAFSYQRTETEFVTTQNVFTGGFGSASTADNWYSTAQTLDTYTLQVFSDWTPNFSTEFKLGAKNVDSPVDPLFGKGAGQVFIDVPSGQIVIGPDQFRHANLLTNDSLQIKLAGEYALGDHTIKGGWERDTVDIFNLFVERALGRLEFDSIADFAAGNASLFQYRNSITGDPSGLAAEWSYDLDQFYIQDEWRPIDPLTLVFGLRYEMYSVDEQPAANATVANVFGLSNQETLDGRDAVLPRFGFSYDLDDRTRFTGGAGKFTGGTPNVWASNPYQNDGVSLAGFDCTLTSCGGLEATFLTGLTSLLPQTGANAQLSAQTADVNIIDPSFDLPTVWKYNLAAEREMDFSMAGLGDGWRAGVDLLYTDVDNAIAYVELSSLLAPLPDAPGGLARYGRTPGAPLVYSLTNTNEGWSRSLVLSLGKDWETSFGDMSMFLAHNMSDGKDVNSGTSSIATSNYGNLPTDDFNDPTLAVGNEVIKNRSTLRLSWAKAFFGDYQTRATLFGEHRSGRPFSLVSDRRGVGADLGDPRGNDEARTLIYIPTGPSDPAVSYKSGASYDQLAPWIEGYGLDQYAGGFAPRNAFTSDYVTKFDLSLAQEFPAFRPNDRALVTFDIENVGNLLNSDWGRVEQVPFGRSGFMEEVYTGDYNPVTNQYEISRVFNFGNPQELNSLESVWKVQFGLRYEF